MLLWNIKSLSGLSKVDSLDFCSLFKTEIINGKILDILVEMQSLLIYC